MKFVALGSRKVVKCRQLKDRLLPIALKFLNWSQQTRLAPGGEQRAQPSSPSSAHVLSFTVIRTFPFQLSVSRGGRQAVLHRHSIYPGPFSAG